MLKTLGEHAQATPQTPSQRTKYFSFQASALTFLNYHASLHLDSYMRKNYTIPEFLNLLSRVLQDTIVTNMQASSLECASPVRNATSGLSNAATPWTSCTALVNPKWASAEQRNGQGKRHSRKYSVKHSGHWRGLDKVFISNLRRLVIFQIHVFHTANATARLFFVSKQLGSRAVHAEPHACILSIAQSSLYCPHNHHMTARRQTTRLHAKISYR